MTDSKSVGGDTVWVRVPPPAPARRKRHIACDEFFMLRIKTRPALILLLLASEPDSLRWIPVRAKKEDIQMKAT